LVPEDLHLSGFTLMALPFPREQDIEYMRLALTLSRESKAEEDGRIHPCVGAVIVTPKGNAIFSHGYRGQRVPGRHAEQEALLDLPGHPPDKFRDTIVYTTLEPCTVRGKEEPCCSRLIRANVSEIVIGMLDPNRDIRGKGWWELEEKGIKVRYFDSDIAREVRELNHDFIRYQLGVGLLITSVQPQGSSEIVVTPDHRARREVLTVPSGKLTIRGTYRVKPMRGDRIVMFVRRGDRYFPQQAIDFDHDRDKDLWQAPSAWVDVAEGDHDNELIVARVSDDLHIAFQHYVTVHADIQKWIAIIMNPEPPGFERLAKLWVRIEK
jgi:pyrimidine deaminase RibD-like protein